MQTASRSVALAFAGTFAGAGAMFVAAVCGEMPAGYAAAAMTAYCGHEFLSNLDWNTLR